MNINQYHDAISGRAKKPLIALPNSWSDVT